MFKNSGTCWVIINLPRFSLTVSAVLILPKKIQVCLMNSFAVDPDFALDPVYILWVPLLRSSMLLKCKISKSNLVTFENSDRVIL